MVDRLVTVAWGRGRVRISVVSDEISDDFEEAVQLGLRLGVNTYELRWVRPPGTFQRCRVGEVVDAEALALSSVAERHGALIGAIAPGVFQCPWNEGRGLEAQISRLERAFSVAAILRVRDIVVHSFQPPHGHRNGACPSGVIDALGQAAEHARAAGFRLLLKNSADCYADTGAHTAAIAHAVHSSALGVSWDPCHAARLGEDAVGDGYAWVSPFVRDVRIKDQAPHDGRGYEYTVLAQGSLDWPRQLRALASDSYQGTATLGSQLEPRLLTTMRSLEALRQLLKEATVAAPRAG